MARVSADPDVIQACLLTPSLSPAHEEKTCTGESLKPWVIKVLLSSREGDAGGAESKRDVKETRGAVSLLQASVATLVEGGKERWRKGGREGGSQGATIEGGEWKGDTGWEESW